MDLTKTIRAARRVSTPLIAIQTADPAATMRTIEAAVNGEAPKVRWDIMNGLVPLSDSDPSRTVSRNAILSLVDPSMVDQIQALTSNPGEAISLCGALPRQSIVCVLNAQRFLDNEAVIQGIWNLRDQYKADQRTMFLLGPQFKLPAELSQDVMVIDEELPTDEELAPLVTAVHDAVGRPVDNMAELLPPLRGLAAFPAEQSLAMSLTKDGIDMAGLWVRKRRIVEQADGLRFLDASENLDSVRGNAQLIKLLYRLFNGPMPPDGIVFVDEVEKAVGGSGASGIGDSSGVSQDQLGVILKGFDELKALGLQLVGHPGTGKSSLARAVGAQFGKWVLSADFGATKDSLVGSSEAKIRQMFKVIKALAGGNGRVIFIATSNRLEAVPPELQRRLGKFGTWMMDLPTADERKGIWEVHAAKWSVDLATAEMPDDTDWTGSDIANCCELSYRLTMSPREAADFLTPVAKSKPEAIKRLRMMAHNAFRSASSPGYYMMPGETTSATAGRTIALEDN